MDAKTKLIDEAIPDLEHQLLLPPPTPAAAVDHKPSGGSCDCELAHAGSASPTAARTLAMVTATAALAFVVDLAARGEQVYLAVFAAAFVIACACSSLLTWCVARKAKVCGQQELRPWPKTAAARVLFWSFAMALVQTMTIFASRRAPRAEWALCTLAWLVGSLCFAEIVPFRSPLA